MIYKRRLCAIIVFAMVLTSGLSIGYAEIDDGRSDKNTAAETGAAFTDIKGHWAEAIIKEAAELEIVGGYPDGNFLPDNLIKREEFYKLLANILTVTPDISSTKIQFRDVLKDEWYVPTIKIAVAAGITSGYGDGTFGIGLMISRQEAAKVAGSVISEDVKREAKGAETVLDRRLIADWAYDYVDLMFKKGYMKGDTEGNFRPTMALTRAEAATILLNIKKNETVIAANADVIANSNCLALHKGAEGAFIAGDGTKTDPYEINTEAQLDHMRMHATEGAFFIMEKNVAITEDYATKSPADRDDADWRKGNFEPIGSKENPFKGHLDGNGYTISGLNIEGTEGTGDKARAASYAGLIGYLAKGASVTDLIIDASEIDGNQYTGAVAGYNEGTIKNCQLGKKGIVNGNNDTGGLVGYSNNLLSGLCNLGTVSGTNMNTGGIVGSIYAPGTALLDCQNEGVVSGNEKIGGIAGNFVSSPDSASVIKECDNKGAVKGRSYQAGGITGYAGGEYYSVTIENCGNLGEVTGSGVNGGIAGSLGKGKSFIIQCKNTGTVEGSGSGGIAGNNRGEISDSYNSGTVMADVDGGGIAAYQLDGEGEISKCYNEGKVVANSYAGGIIGENGSTVAYSYNCGYVRGTSLSGGIAGKNEGTVKYVYGAGEVTGENSSGSLIGRNRGTLSNAFWLNTTASLPIGLEDNSLNSSIIKLTQEELSGQKKIKTLDGYKMLIDLLNDKAENWKYSYNIIVQAPNDTSVVSDGGGVVSPLEILSTDSKGNTIDPSDLNSKYLYPVIIK